ncbi:MAG: hypothetical protein ACYCYF_03350 [Anaerolineae bacterium]
MDDQLRDLIAGDDDEEEETRGLGALSGILGALMGGAAPAGSPTQGSGAGMGDLLGMLGGASAQPEQSSPQQGGGMGDLLGMLGGGQAQQPQSAPQGGGLGDLLGMLGGASTQQQQPPAQSSGLMGGLLGSLLGGEAQAGATSNPLTSGIAKVLSEKLGVSTAVANTIVGFALTLLMQSLQKRAVQRQAPGEGVALAPETLNAPELGDVLKTLGGRTEGAQGLAMRGASQLAAQAGIDQDTAERGLAEAFRLLAGQQGT